MGTPENKSVLRRSIIFCVLFAPVLLAITVPFIVSGIILPGPEWAIILTTEQVKLFKVFPEEVEMGLWNESTLHRIGETTYKLGIKSTFIARFIFITVAACVLVVVLGNIFAWYLLYKKLLKNGE